MDTGTFGLILVCMGLFGVVASGRLTRTALGADLERLAHRLRSLDRAAIPILVAVIGYLVARQLGHGRTGLYVCISALVVTHVVIAAVKLRVTEVSRRSLFQLATVLELLAYWTTFAGVGVYLLRS